MLPEVCGLLGLLGLQALFGLVVVVEYKRLAELDVDSLEASLSAAVVE